MIQGLGFRVRCSGHVLLPFLDQRLGAEETLLAANSWINIQDSLNWVRWMLQLNTLNTKP